MKPNLASAYKLFHQGTLALAEMEHHGMRIDTDYLDKTIPKMKRKIVEAEESLKKDPIWKAWARRFGDQRNIDSPNQMRWAVYEHLKYKPTAFTDSGLPSTDEAALEDIADKIPFVKNHLLTKKLKKVLGTYLIGVRRETVNGFAHPMYSLAGGSKDDEGKGGAVSYRGSCVAKGTLVEVVRDVFKFPKGIPIEQIKEGDQVYCYDDSLRLTIREVLWAGITGVKQVVRLHWNARSKHGYIDVTPDHRIRMRDGEYKEARDVKVGDRTLAMGRTNDMLYETGNSNPLYDHRLVYQTLVGDLPDDMVVHHKDENHYNNVPTNLKKLTKSEHAALHASTSLTDKVRRKAYRVRRKRIKLGLITFPKGEDSPRWKHLTKIGALRILSSFGGKVTKARNSGIMDFTTFKKKAAQLGINLKAVKDRYDNNGRYITINRIKKAAKKGVRCIKKRFGCNHYKAYRLAKDRGFSVTEKRYQFNSINNHRITRIEWLKEKVEVYDLTVKDTHNFIANEICVHNCSIFNFQNWPIRNPEMAAMIRPMCIARDNHQLVEVDLSTNEVRVAACNCKDPKLIEYMKGSGDMHLDAACDLFFLKPDQVDKKGSRDAAKNMFIFPQFFGSYYVDCAKAIWKGMHRRKFKINGKDTLIVDHLKAKGIKSLGKCDPDSQPVRGTFEYHVKQVEKILWEDRFKVYTAVKKKWWAEYQEKGYLDMFTGFRCQGVYRRNQVLNFRIQGPAFHILLQSIIWLTKIFKKRKMRSIIVGQIHDSLLIDAHKDEIEEVLKLCKRVMTVELPKVWKWMQTVPFIVEADVAPLGRSWHEKQPVAI